jgi:nitroimidazol reductase NimA-like FMN-containing flavoprotein (pyridoxamine 5'-phosphate oxidase superfamily)
MLRRLAEGIPVCVTVTQLDGLVYSRDAKYHSANYRCVMCFGKGRIIEDETEKRLMFEAMTLRYFRGRTAGRDYTAAPPAHLAATSVVEVVIDEMTAKTREGGPKGPQDASDDAPGTCGVLELRSQNCG